MAASAKTWSKEDIKQLLARRADAVYRGLVVIHSLQTSDERQSGETTHNNGVGWSGFDAPIMTRMYELYRRNGELSEGQFNLVRKKLLRYAGQLARVANGELRVEVAQ